MLVSKQILVLPVGNAVASGARYWCAFSALRRTAVTASPADLDQRLRQQNHQIDTLTQQLQAAREETDRVDDWAMGLFDVLQDVLEPLLKQNPGVRSVVQARWALVAERYDRQEAGYLQAPDHESSEQLEARKKLYRLFDLIGVWQASPPPALGK